MGLHFTPKQVGGIEEPLMDKRLVLSVYRLYSSVFLGGGTPKGVTVGNAPIDLGAPINFQ